jgi:hypothetical protein
LSFMAETRPWWRLWVTLTSVFGVIYFEHTL